MGELVIRKGEEQDIDGIEAIEQVCFASPWSRESIKSEILDNPLATFIVAVLDDMVVGFVGIWTILDEGHINNVAVSPLCRRQHIGATLIDTMIRVTEAAGIKSQTLEVRASNYPAINLYEKFGFERAGLRKGYYEDNGEDAIIMWRKKIIE